MRPPQDIYRDHATVFLSRVEGVSALQAAITNLAGTVHQEDHPNTEWRLAGGRLPSSMLQSSMCSSACELHLDPSGKFEPAPRDLRFGRHCASGLASSA